MKIMAIYGSGGRGGNTEYLGEQTLAGVKATKVFLQEKEIQSIVDQRHSGTGFDQVNRGILSGMLRRQ